MIDKTNFQKFHLQTYKNETEYRCTRARFWSLKIGGGVKLSQEYCVQLPKKWEKKKEWRIPWVIIQCNWGQCSEEQAMLRHTVHPVLYVGHILNTMNKFCILSYLYTSSFVVQSLKIICKTVLEKITALFLQVF